MLGRIKKDRQTHGYLFTNVSHGKKYFWALMMPVTEMEVVVPPYTLMLFQRPAHFFGAWIWQSENKPHIPPSQGSFGLRSLLSLSCLVFMSITGQYPVVFPMDKIASITNEFSVHFIPRPVL